MSYKKILGITGAFTVLWSAVFFFTALSGEVNAGPLAAGVVIISITLAILSTVLVWWCSKTTAAEWQGFAGECVMGLGKLLVIAVVLAICAGIYQLACRAEPLAKSAVGHTLIWVDDAKQKALQER